MELSDLTGMGPARVRHLRAVGINSLRDLLFFFPIRYEDHIHVTPIAETGEGEYLVQGFLRESAALSYFHGKSRITARLWDENNHYICLCWFNEPWMKQILSPGKQMLLYGTIRAGKGSKTMYNARIVSERIWMPVYKKIPGLPAKTLHHTIREALTFSNQILQETLPMSLVRRYHLIGLADALRIVHCPQSPEQIQAARRRFDFEDMLVYLISVSVSRQLDQPGWPLNISADEPTFFWNHVAFQPTEAQKRVLFEIASDLRKDHAMARLVQGDVGCGKTILAFGSIFLVCRQGFQSAMMAPTEILARQHYENAVNLLEPLGIHCALLTGSTRAQERKKILTELKNGNCHAVFGTHALISTSVEYNRLGLVITDEQHRFGVRQRSALQQKGQRFDQRSPHVLVMSATPIPRTLALILYGDLSLSLVDELPPGRIPVKTRLVPMEKRMQMYTFLRDISRKGQQAYVVCPLVEDSEQMPDVISAENLYKELKTKLLPDLRIGLTWGGQNSEEKSKTLKDFSDGKLDVLVATTVIEVGVNVPNATVMIVENAERYGLSQLHQLRGRVGRGKAESWCFLRSNAGKKLKKLCETQDGFEVARMDLEMRGPGDLMGTRQSGEALQRLAGSGDPRILDEVLRCAEEIDQNPAMSEEKALLVKLAAEKFSHVNGPIARN